jgi:FkbM family methyltransferase
MDHISVRLSNGVTLAVPATLKSTSTFVLLEQETWFEKEYAFVARLLKPGMTVIDVGANVGVYSLAMAQQVAPGGHVIAYEPASESRRLLDISRAFNKASNLEVVAAALSDGERRGHLGFGASSEYNSLGSDAPGEDVRITSLDHEDAVRSRPSPDFIKIDAEGEEARILAGGRGFFDRHSPLVMFEIQALAGIKADLRSAFADIGYDCYRALAGEPILVSSPPLTPLDTYELNLFAAKPDRARRLAADGLLVDPLPSWTPDATARNAAVKHLRGKPFTPPIAALMNFDGIHDPNYLDALAGYARWLDHALPMAQRCGALAFAFTALQSLCQRAPSLARLSTFARCAWDWGRRTECVAALLQIINMSNQSAPPLTEPFWPASARFDDITAPAREDRTWFLCAALEQFERANLHSSLFSNGPSPYLPWLCAQPFASAEMERRRFLQASRARQPTDVPPRLRKNSPDHRNAALWRDIQAIMPR